jgi:hypothetical protein
LLQTCELPDQANTSDEKSDAGDMVLLEERDTYRYSESDEDHRNGQGDLPCPDTDRKGAQVEFASALSVISDPA